MLKKIAKSLLPLILGGFLVWYSLSGMDTKTVLQYIKTANYWWIALGLFFGVLSHLSRAYRWKFLLEPMGYKPRLENSTMAVLIGYLVNYAVPRAGEVSRAAVMSNYENIPFQKGFGTIVAERVADLLMLFIIVAITLLIQFDFIYNLLISKLNPIKIIILALILLSGFAIFSLYVKKAKSGLGLKIKDFVSKVIEGAISIFKMKKKWSFIFHTIFIWVMYIAMFWATIPSVKGLDVSLGAVLVGFIAGAFSIAATNGGVGSYPVAVAAAFMLFGVEKSMSEAFGWIMWSAQTLMIIIFGGLSFVLLPVYNKNKT